MDAGDSQKAVSQEAITKERERRRSNGVWRLYPTDCSRCWMGSVGPNSKFPWLMKEQTLHQLLCFSQKACLQGRKWLGWSAMLHTQLKDWETNLCYGILEVY